MIAWLKIGRGKVWHLDEPGTVIRARPWCGRRGPVEELSKDLPPIGGRVCPSCARLAAELAARVQSAVHQDQIVDLSPRPEVEPLIDEDEDDGDFLGGNRVPAPDAASDG